MKYIDHQVHADQACSSCTYKTLDDTSYAAGDLILAPYVGWIILENYPRARDSLRIVAEFLNTNPNLAIELISHTDYRADAEFNMVLTQGIASECSRLISELGNIDPCRIIPVGKGESSPRVIDSCPLVFDPLYGQIPDNVFSPGDTLNEDFIKALPSNKYREAAHYLNRRLEIKVISVDYPVKKENLH